MNGESVADRRLLGALVERQWDDPRRDALAAHVDLARVPHGERTALDHGHSQGFFEGWAVRPAGHAAQLAIAEVHGVTLARDAPAGHFVADQLARDSRF